MNKKAFISRRSFLRRSAVLAAGPWIIPASARGADGLTAPGNRITTALIGRGVMGSGHLFRMTGDAGVQVLGVCDPDPERREEGRAIVDEAYAAQRASGSYKGCVATNDFRELLARPDLDAVVIATPDHWHTTIAIAAARARKDIYCEKPVSITLEEGRRLTREVRRAGVVFQTGTQYRSIPVVRKVCRFIREGGLGRVRQAFVIWTALQGWFKGPRFAPYVTPEDAEYYGKRYEPVNLPLPAMEPPRGLDWPMWVGPAPWRDYHPLYHVNPKPGVVPWSFCEDFGCTSSTWHHSHSADVMQWAIRQEETGPVEIIHPSTGEFPTLTARYPNGTLVHHVDHLNLIKELYHAVPDDAPLEGMFGGVFVGERGWLTALGGASEIIGQPESLFKEMGLERREVVIGANDHHANWLECIRTRARTYTDEELGHRAASLGHLGIISCKLGRSLKWDPVKEEFQADEEANRLRSRAVREPWGI